MSRENRPPPGSNLGRAWTELRRDRDRAISVAKQCLALLADMEQQGEIPTRFELTLDSIKCQLMPLVGAERTPRRIADVGEKQDAIPSSDTEVNLTSDGGPAHSTTSQAQLFASLGSQEQGDSDSDTD